LNKKSQSRHAPQGEVEITGNLMGKSNTSNLSAESRGFQADLRAISEVPELKGDEAGADDYVTKPNSYKEWMEEVKALYRRLIQVSS
jgi:CheY-like chemotaxis protein